MTAIGLGCWLSGSQSTEIIWSSTRNVAWPPKPLNSAARKALTASRKADVPTCRAVGGSRLASNAVAATENESVAMFVRLLRSHVWLPLMPARNPQFVRPRVDDRAVVLAEVRRGFPNLQQVLTGRKVPRRLERERKLRFVPPA